jgi:sugar lactone lactonase YvrE
LKLDASSQVQKVLRDNDFNHPGALAVGTNGILYVADTGTNQVVSLATG